MSLLLYSTSQAASKLPLEQDPGKNGLISVEAENYDHMITNGSHFWKFITQTDNEFIPANGWSGTGAMQSQPTEPGGGTQFDGINFTRTSAALNFEVNFVKTGTHYVWVLGYGFGWNSDSCHVTLDGEENTTAYRISHNWGPGYGWGRNLFNNTGRATLEIPSLGLHTLGLWMREDGFVADKLLLTTNPDYAPWGKGPKETRQSYIALDPSPPDGATDVGRYVWLSWVPSPFAVRHQVYLGSDFADVSAATLADPRDLLVGEGTETTLMLSLALGTTYYWRVDEVSAANDPPYEQIHTGNVWSFTVEPMTVPAKPVLAMASSIFDVSMGPENTVNGSGLNQNNQHSSTLQTMWLSHMADSENPWIAYDFGRTVKLDRADIWNHNSPMEKAIGYGIREARIATSFNGESWTELKTVELAQAGGTDSQESETIELDGISTRHVRITGLSNYSPLGLKQVGLSEVRFNAIPLLPRNPHPENNSLIDGFSTLLRWRPGHLAGEHEVVFGSDRDAVIGNMAIVRTTQVPYFKVDSLDLGTTYYWKINEVNENKTPSISEGDLWSFHTSNHIPVDDMESYKAEPSSYIQLTWEDGSNNYTENGSLVMDIETTLIYEGIQALPITYNNTRAPQSFVTRYFDPPVDWTIGTPEVLSLQYRGHPPAYTAEPDGRITVSAYGKDIGGNLDDFRFVYKRLVGDGSITACIESVHEAHNWTKAGVMIREKLNAESINAYTLVTPTGRAGIQWRRGTSERTVGTYSESEAVTYPHWVRLTRTGNLFKGESSNDGIHWKPMRQWHHPGAPSEMSIIMSDEIYIGLAVTSHNATSGTSAVFSNVTTSGAIYDETWATKAIGAYHPSNDPHALYVTLTDSKGSETVFRSGTEETNAVMWKNWQIPITESPHLDLSSIRSLTIGVGNPDDTQPRGERGTIYIDHIKLTRP